MQSDVLDKTHLLDLSREELAIHIEHLGMKRYRSNQVFKGIYSELLPNFHRITTLSKPQRILLDKSTTIHTFSLIEQTQSSDHTTKYLWRLKDNLTIESVIIYEGKRITFCISSQVGCALDCKFCATGKMGFIRNLTAGEIVEQVTRMTELANGKSTNIVFMGMGEPLLNINQVLKACRLISDPEGLCFARRKITISTSGVINGIRKLADLGAPYSLAVSLNSADENIRRGIMPISWQYPLSDLSEALTYYYKKSRKRISFEYIMIREKNDSLDDAKKIATFVARYPCKINLIPSNSQNPDYPPSDPQQILMFSDYLRSKNFTVTVRMRKGWEIQAACGQLYTLHTDHIGVKIPINK
jgi:23S rRNA (adenine2503-C2)-methyltransferase